MSTGDAPVSERTRPTYRPSIGERLQPRRIGLYLFLAIMAFLFLLPLFWWISSAVRSTASIPVGLSLLDTWWPGEFKFFENLETAFDLYPMARFFLNTHHRGHGRDVWGSASSRRWPVTAWRSSASLGRNLAFAAVLAFLLVPQIVVVVPLFQMMANLGLVNSYAALIVPFVVTPLGHLHDASVHGGDPERVHGVGEDRRSQRTADLPERRAAHRAQRDHHARRVHLHLPVGRAPVAVDRPHPGSRCTR